MDLLSLGASNTYTDAIVSNIQTGIASVVNEGNKLIFYLTEGGTVECIITGLSDENYTTAEKRKVASLDDNILKRFTYVNGNLLFEGQVISGGSIDLTNYIDIATFNSHVQDKNNPHGVTLQSIINVGIESLLDKQTLVYDLESDTWKNGDMVITNDGMIKLNSTDTNLSYLSDLIDNSTIIIENDKLIIDKLNGLETTKLELGYIHGLDKNIMTYLNAIGNSMIFKGVVDTDVSLNAIATKNSGDTYIVKSSVSNSNKTMTFVYDGVDFVPIAETTIEVRNFITNPINLESEVTGILPIDKVNTTTLATKTDLDGCLDNGSYKGSSNGIVKQADTLTGLTKTISQLNNSLDKDSIIEGNNIQIIKNNNGTITISCNGAMSGGGHTIVDSNNNELPQENKLKFGEVFEITDVIESSTTKVDLSDTVKTKINNSLDKETYKGSAEGIVKQADFLSIMKSAQPLQYYGTDSNNNVGLHLFPIFQKENTGIEQRVILNAKTNNNYSINSVMDITDNKVNIDCYKFIAGDVGVVNTIKEFNNANSDNFYYNNENVSFDGGMGIKKSYDIDFTYNNGFYEVDLSSFTTVENIIKKEVI